MTDESKPYEAPSVEEIATEGDALATAPGVTTTN